jgi:hypothetical protein
MAKYTVVHAYSARRDGLQFGPWQPDDVVDLEQADAEWILRDSPGSLAPAADEPAETGERQKLAGRDRQHRGGANRGH